MFLSPLPFFLIASPRKNHPILFQGIQEADGQTNFKESLSLIKLYALLYYCKPWYLKLRANF